MRLISLGLLALPALAACPTAEPDFSLLAGDLPGGALLSAWSNGDEALIVGGHLGSGPGVVVHLQDGALCVEEDVADRALWWIHGARAGEWYAVGEAGTVLHEVDGERSVESLATDATLFGVYDDGEAVWAVGGSFVNGSVGEIWVRRDGAWTLLAGGLPGVVFKVWEGWFVGDGVAWRLGAGDALEPVDLGGEKILTLRGRDAEDDLWAVGGYGQPAVLRGGASGWSEVTVDGLDQPLNGVWTAPGEPVWVAGMRGLLAYTEDGAAWTRPDEPPSYKDFHAAWKHGDDMLFVGGDLLGGDDQRGVIARWGLPSDPPVPEACP